MTEYAMPKLDEPLTDQEFDQLDDFLLSDRCPDESMTMDTLHGFLTAIAIGPQAIKMEEWLPKVWGPSADDLPTFRDRTEERKIVDLIGRFMNEIIMTFDVAPNDYEPLFCECEYQGKTLYDGQAWTWGFWDGVQLRAAAWEPIWGSRLETVVRPVRLLGESGDDDVEESEDNTEMDPVLRHKLSVEVEAAIGDIYRFWLPMRQAN
jgi:uncharacterized protein